MFYIYLFKITNRYILLNSYYFKYLIFLNYKIYLLNFNFNVMMCLYSDYFKCNYKGVNAIFLYNIL